MLTAVQGFREAHRRASRGVWALAFLLIAILAVLPRTGEALSSAQTREAAADAARRLDLQTELPRDTVPRLGWRLSLPPELFWLTVIVGCGVILYSLRGELPLWRWRARGGWSEAEAAAGLGSTTPEAVAAAADDLARQGQFGEAMHALLLQSLADVRQRLDEQFADSLTSREILRSTRLPEPGREPLREIIARVERTYFGEYSAGPEDYRACRQRFGELARVLHAEARA